MSAVSYAEETLGVHEPWQRCQELLARHEEYTECLMDSRRMLRAAEWELESLEEQMFLDVWAELPDASGAEKERQIKKRVAESEGIRKVKDKIHTAKDDVTIYETQLSHIKLTVHAHSTRMHELGGLLFFYGVAKQQSLR
jgi:hypothetical protein